MIKSKCDFGLKGSLPILDGSVGEEGGFAGLGFKEDEGIGWK